MHFSFFIAFVFTRHFPDSSMHFQFHFETSLTLVGWKGTCKCEENLCGADFNAIHFSKNFFPFHFLLFALIFTFLLSFGHVTHISLSSRVKNLISLSSLVWERRSTHLESFLNSINSCFYGSGTSQKKNNYQREEDDSRTSTYSQLSFTSAQNGCLDLPPSLIERFSPVSAMKVQQRTISTNRQTEKSLLKTVLLHSSHDNEQ